MWCLSSCPHHQQPFCEPQAMPYLLFGMIRASLGSWSHHPRGLRAGPSSQGPSHPAGPSGQKENAGVGQGQAETRPGPCLGQLAGLSAGSVPTGLGDSPGHGHPMVSRSRPLDIHGREGDTTSSTSSQQPKLLPLTR